MAYMIKDYRKAVGDGAEKVFKKVVELKCKHSPIASWNEMVSKRSISCSSSGSLALQLGGCMDVGKKMGHTLIKGTGIKPSDIKTIKDAMYGIENIKHCRLIWVNCYMKDLPVWLKQRGVIYIQWSNCCVSAGKGSDDIGFGAVTKKGDIIISVISNIKKLMIKLASCQTAAIILGAGKFTSVLYRKRSGSSIGL